MKFVGSQKVLITGASGFLGSALSDKISSLPRYSLVTTVRKGSRNKAVDAIPIPIASMSAETDWTQALHGVQTVIHTAARVHVMNDLASDPLSEYRKVNVRGTLNLAKQAVAAGVSRFIFISTIKVNGESTLPGMVFTADEQPHPVDPYAISKWETENGLYQIANETKMDVVIIRPPLIYGPGVKANFLAMMRWINLGVPLPLGAIHNKRSLVALENLVSLIVTCIENPAAANQIFLVGDDEDLSTTELLQRIASALGKPARLFPFPTCLINFAASLLGKRGMAQRLSASLQVDISKARKLLDWEPPVSVDEGLRKAADDFKKRSSGL